MRFPVNVIRAQLIGISPGVDFTNSGTSCLENKKQNPALQQKNLDAICAFIRRIAQ